MSGLQLDPDGFIDMDQFPDDGTVLSDADLTLLQEALHSDPVEEPSAEQWDAMFADAVASDEGGPFAVDAFDSGVADIDGEPFGADGSDDVAVDATADGDDDTDVSDLAAAAKEGLSDEGGADDDAGYDDGAEVPLDDAAVDDPIFDDGGLDLTADEGVDDAFATDAVDDVPADIANNDFEDLL